MRSTFKKIGRRSLSIVLSLCLVAACLATTALPSNEVRAGLITNVLTGKWGAIAMGTIERGVIFGVSKAKNAAEEDGMYQALRWTQRILAGNSGLVASDTLAAVKKMSAQLNALVSYTMESNGEITDMLNQLETDNYKSSFKTCFDAVDNFGSGYNDILGDFDRFIDAFVDYAEARNSNPDADVDKSALSRAYSLLIQNYFSSDDTESELFIKPLMGSPTSVAVLSVISPYDRSQEIGSEEDFTDPDRWILANGAGVLSGTTYMETFYNYITRVTNLENNVHDQMRSAANFAADAAYKYTQAYRYYAEFKSMLLAADSTIYDDPYVAQNRAETNIDLLWENFYLYTNKLQRGLNQMMTIHSEVYDTFMRSYDIETSLTINGFAKSSSLYNAFTGYQSANGYSGITWNINGNEDSYYFSGVTLSKNKIESTEKAYQFRLVSETGNNSYAIRQSGNGNNPFYCHDLAESVQVTDEKALKVYSTVISLDGLNLLKDTDNGYKAIAGPGSLSAITSNKNVARSNVDTITDYIDQELRFGGITNTHLPDVSYRTDSADSDTIQAGPNFLLLRTPLIWDETNAAANMLKDHDMSMTLANASMPSIPSTGKIDLEEKLKEPAEKGILNEKEMVVFYSGTPTATLTYNEINSVCGDTRATVTPLADYLSGSKTNTTELITGSETSVVSGNIIDIAFRPKAGKTLDHIVLKDASGNIFDKLLADEVVDYDPDAFACSTDKPTLSASYTISVQELLETMPADSNGYYHITFPMPYKDCTLELQYDPADTSLYTYTSTLVDEKTDNGSVILLYGGYESIGEKKFKAGEEVNVITTGYNGAIAKNLRITDENDNDLDISITDNNSGSDTTAVKVSPTERSFSFTMPAQDIKVYPVSQKTYSVTVYDEDTHCRHKFRNIDCFNFQTLTSESGWENASSISYAPGGTVCIDFIIDPGYILSSVVVQDVDNRKYISATPTQNGIRFTMPEGRVTVYYEAEKTDFSKYIASVNTVDGVDIQFLDEDGIPLNLSSLQAAPGDTIALRAECDESICRMNGITVKEKDGDTVGYTDNGNKTYSFTMPEADVTIDPEVTKNSEVTIVYNGNCTDDKFTFEDGSTDHHKFFEGESVVLSGTDRLLSADIRILSASDGSDITSQVSMTKDNDKKQLIIIMPAEAINVSVPGIHNYSNGFCTVCGHYETPEYDSEKNEYMIRNGGNLFWMSAMMNSDHKNADFENADTSANMVLMNDIDLENRQWVPMVVGNASNPLRYSGHFSGNGHTISGFYMNVSGLPYHPSFFGDCENAVAEEFSIKGKMVSDGSVPREVSVITNSALNCTFRHIYNYVDIGLKGSTSDTNIGGMIISSYATTFDRCVNFGNITADSAGTVSGFIYWMQNGGAVINCADIGNISVDNGFVTAGFLGKFYYKTDFSFIANSYSYGQLSGESRPVCAESDYDPDLVIRHCYFRSGTAKYTNDAEEKSADRFRSGEVGFLLNSVLEDNEQVWYQNIDNGRTPDDYPLPDDTRGTIYYIESENRYSNYPDGNPPEPSITVSIDKDKFIYDENGTATSYLTFESTGSSDPITVDKNTDVVIRYETDDDHILDSVMSEASGVKEALSFSNGSVICHVTDKDIVIIPGFIETPAKETGIRTYEELVDFAENVRSNTPGYRKANVWLENNINAPENSKWTVAIGTAETAFEGTFDGRGYCIIGLDIDIKDQGGLFGVIGKNGIVRDLAVIDCSFAGMSNNAGGIAAENNGTIDHCISGINTVSSKLIKTLSGEQRTLSSMNSTVNGVLSGGIAACNNGTIKGSRSSAFVIGNDCGGIAGVNNGKIYGCANNGPVGKNSVTIKRCGGIAAYNNGTVVSSYNSGNINGTSDTVRASVAAQNNSDNISNVFYAVSGKYPAVADGSINKLSNTCESLTIEYMITSDFADKLNSVTDDTVDWKHIEYKSTIMNQGFPIVRGRFIENTEIANEAKIRISAFIQRSMMINYIPINYSSASYNTMLSAAGTRTVTCAYDLTAADPNGNEMPAELWCEGITISIPVSTDDVRIITLNENGEAMAFTPDSIENGWATFSLTEPTGFAVAENITSDKNNDKDTGNFNTGDSSLPLTMSVAMIIASILAILISRRKKESE